MLFFTGAMKHLVLFVFLITCAVSCHSPQKNLEPEKVKVALRTIGHELLLAQKDSTSLVLPVESLSEDSYRLKFQHNLMIKPRDLVSIVKRVFEEVSLSEDYILEVSECEDGEVAYSYQVYQKENIEIIPCLGRELPVACYNIVVSFSVKNETSNWVIWLLLIPVLGVSYLTIKYFYSGKNKIRVDNGKEISIGTYSFFPKQLKLVKQATEITISRKECEILELFVERPNQIITREELTKRIWEDNGVIVGRSLDTYVSKLRKKLQDDENIKITNVHGVGYKLEVGV